jgi:hypothetical protein
MSRSDSERRVLLSKAMEEPDALGMFVQASARLQRVVPFDAAVWRVTDPETGIMTTPMHGESIESKAASNTGRPSSSPDPSTCTAT